MSIVIGVTTAVLTAAGLTWYRFTNTEPSVSSDLTLIPDRIADTANPDSVPLSIVPVYSKRSEIKAKPANHVKTTKVAKTAQIIKTTNPLKSEPTQQSNMFVATLDEITRAKNSLRRANTREIPKLDFSKHSLPLNGHAAILQELQKTLVKRQLIY